MIASHILLKPRVSEKAYNQSESVSTYVFDVPLRTNKQQITHAVETQFGVKVHSVNTAILKGKSKRTVRKTGKAEYGSQRDTKKAYVMLEQGQSLPLFQSEDEKTDSSKKGASK